MESEESQKRVCRCCNRTYDYPIKKSLATRFYCATCSQLDKDSRGLFEGFNKRLRKMGAELEKVQQKLVQRDAE
ncbi:MAG: hypothetical protein GY842_05325 [bacterium]|nr:hypothetical protein [bacterium]